MSDLHNKKIVFFVQGEGRGHLTQAIAAKELIEECGGKIAAVFVGTSPQRKIPQYFLDSFSSPVYFIQSPNFVQDKNGRSVRFLYSILLNLVLIPKYLMEIYRIHSILRSVQPDLLINFFEILGSFYAAASGRKYPAVNIAHQYIFLHPDFRFPDGNALNKILIKFYTYCTSIGSDKKLALSFYHMRDDDRRRISIVPPLLPQDILGIQDYSHGEHFLVYLLNAGYADDIIEWHSRHPHVVLRCFWDSPLHGSTWTVNENLIFYKIDRKGFVEQLRTCKGIVCTAGFESIAEACYFEKSVFAVPVSGHIEQVFNAFDIESSGLGTSSDRFNIDTVLTVTHIPPSEQKRNYRAWIGQSKGIMEPLLSSLIKSR